MAICENCGKRFNKDEAESEFAINTYLLNYYSFKKSLCGKCAVNAIDNGEEECYFEECENCGKIFDLINEEELFNSNFPWYNGTSLRDYWNTKILCSKCVIKENDL